MSPTGTVASSDLHDRIRALVDRRGLPAAARALGLSREAATRILARLPVRKGTIALAEQALRASGIGPETPGKKPNS